MKLVFATHNINKVKEIRPLLPQTINLLTLSAINCNEEIAETAETIAGNSMLKAEYVSKNYQVSCFADDTGLEVAALNGAPGVYSARYAGPQKIDADNVDKLLKELKGVENRQARFKTVITLILNGVPHTFTGICEGTITKDRKGNRGFGYDPIFIPKGKTLSFAEMDARAKNEISHRGQALQKLLHFLHENSTLNPQK